MNMIFICDWNKSHILIYLTSKTTTMTFKLIVIKRGLTSCIVCTSKHIKPFECLFQEFHAYFFICYKFQSVNAPTRKLNNFTRQIWKHSYFYITEILQKRKTAQFLSHYAGILIMFTFRFKKVFRHFSWRLYCMFSCCLI